MKVNWDNNEQGSTSMEFVDSMDCKEIIRKSFGKEVNTMICKKCGSKNCKCANDIRYMSYAQKTRVLLLSSSKKRIDRALAVSAKGSH